MCLGRKQPDLDQSNPWCYPSTYFSTRTPRRHVEVPFYAELEIWHSERDARLPYQLT